MPPHVGTTDDGVGPLPTWHAEAAVFRCHAGREVNHLVSDPRLDQRENQTCLSLNISYRISHTISYTISYV